MDGQATFDLLHHNMWKRFGRSSEMVKQLVVAHNMGESTNSSSCSSALRRLCVYGRLLAPPDRGFATGEVRPSQEEWALEGAGESDSNGEGGVCQW